MEASNDHPIFRRRRLNTYKAYSIGCAIAWAVLWAILAATATADTLHHVLLLFLGWVIGWTSATIARAVYPPPRRWRSTDAGSS